MSVRKRNEYLEGDESDEEVGNGYDSDEAEKSRGAVSSRSNKRRKTDGDSDEESFHSFAEDDTEKRAVGDVRNEASKPATKSADRFVLGSDFEDEERDAVGLPDEDAALAPTVLASTTKSRTLKSVAAAEKAARKSGVVYISRVPPFMKPQTLRHFLTPHASKGLGRIFLTPEDHTTHVQRVKRGGNKKKSFTDGWVEFTSKTEAQAAAEMLNGGIIGGKKGNFYHDDLWNMKYLKGFKWSHLTEQIANENAERAARLREEVRRTRKENKSFLEDVERGKMLEGMESKKRAKRKAEQDSGIPDSGDVKPARPAREFKQRKVQAKEGGDGSGKPSAELQRVLGKIF
ncbi:hypothetical protein LTR36_009127 [Oleoguttula mirabilis]|uniref:18S rRNA factor 2 n=1 Tax=Oleoguttula mirabilis TaxID=1507867 RepID=A0AAV9J658_9PEZI|nr:hypothetical protein LTR36_009127 [Oleoguttula mirabilis]